jgi:hypothetical protein
LAVLLAIASCISSQNFSPPRSFVTSHQTE